MSKLLTTYANNCGIQVTCSPSLPETYFPSPERYITVQNSSGLPAKNYDYYSEVASLIKPYLDKHNIQIVQIGEAKDRPVEHAHSYNGTTNIRQSAYLVKNALLHLGNDSIWVHFAGVNKVPVVALYGTTLSDVCGPYFHGEITLIDSHRDGNRPTNTQQENPKTINFIKPEEVAREVLKLLKIEHSINVETLHIGRDYHREILEVVTDIKNPPHLLKDQLLNLRMDYNFDEGSLHHHLHFNKSAISTDKPIDINLLLSKKQNVMMVIYYINGTYDKAFIKALHYAGLPYKLVTTLTGNDLQKARLDLFDFNPIEEKPVFSKKDLENYHNLTHNTVFKSNKLTLSKGKIYTSVYHYKNDLNIVDKSKNIIPLGNALNDEEFWSQLNHYYVFNYV